MVKWKDSTGHWSQCCQSSAQITNMTRIITYLMCAYCVTINDSSGCSPNFVMLGREITLPVDIMYPIPKQLKEYTCTTKYVDWLRQTLHGCSALRMCKTICQILLHHQQGRQILTLSHKVMHNIIWQWTEMPTLSILSRMRHQRRAQ